MDNVRWCRSVMHMMDRCLRQRMQWRRMVHILGESGGGDCLHVENSSGAFSHLLKQASPGWQSVALTEEAGKMHAFWGDGGSFMPASGTLPFDDKSFDVVVLNDVLDYYEKDVAIIKESHRILKPAGMLILFTGHAKPGLLWPLKNLLGVGCSDLGLNRQGYTEPELFAAMKDGFDVQHLRYYSGFFVEMVYALQLWSARKGGWLSVLYPTAHVTETPSETVLLKAARHTGIFRVFEEVARALDSLLFFLRGYRMMARARRRLWIPRKTPVLVDGRSIAEAAINTRIGTAAPF